MSEIQHLWEQIEMWYERNGAAHLLNTGATEQEIAAMEAEFGFPIPTELRESLLRHNGSREYGWGYGDLLSLEGIKYERDIWMGLVNDGTFADNADHNEGHSLVQSGWWCASWIPIHADGGGNGYFIDAAEKYMGQVRFMDHEMGAETEIMTYAEYLGSVLSELQAGKYHYYKNPKIDYEGIVTEQDIKEFETW